MESAINKKLTEQLIDSIDCSVSTEAEMLTVDLKVSLNFCLLSQN